MKTKLFYFLLGVIISGSCVYAVTQINASQVTYTKNGTDTTVDAALNDLYTIANKPILNNLSVVLRNDTYVTSYTSNGNLLTSGFSNYRYFKITDITSSGTSRCEAKGWVVSTETAITFTTNTQYNLSDYLALYASATAATQGSLGRCAVTINFYN